MTIQRYNEVAEQVYNHIAFLRAGRQITRQEMAQALGISYQELGYIERGNIFPGLELALRISEYFAVPLEDVFSRTPFEEQDRRA
jgi:putative transcriptional regulator